MNINYAQMKYLGFLALLALAACSTTTATESDSTPKSNRPLAKFEPADGKVLLFAGQELESIGGLEAPYNDGYLDHFPKPAGWTAYSNLSPGDTSFGFIQKGLDGMFSSDDWGDSPSNMTLQVNDADFDGLALAIGLSLVNHEGAVANGERDSLIQVMGEFFQSLGGRPVFLRIGYEFDGASWNNYDREDFVAAFRHIKTKLDAMGVDNVAYTWQSTGWVSNLDQLEGWYPGDEYVDWCAYSFFSRWDEAKMIDFARDHGKPVLIAEATPTVSDYTAKFNGQTKPMVLGNPAEAQLAWNKWFEPFLKTIHENPDVVKGISYINCNWRSHPMWEENPTFQLVDARIQTSPLIKEKWLEEVTSDRYVKLEW
ncbi:MAG TPA: endo-1,3-beta-xylanase [Cytophagales bacterium]|nr:endo-1,3-beta-xylanase [Cytophagales bacterium]